MKLIKSKYFYISILVLAFAGFLDASYLTILHYKNAIPPCTISGCEIVLTSKYAVILGLPIALIGSLFYFLLVILSVALLTSRTKTFEQAILIISASGFVVSLVLIYIQLVIINAWCQYCVISEVISFLIFGLAFLFLHLQSNKGR